ncbi:MAG: glycosyltransferase [Nitrospinae bacterium]|nr:glycosyltransferase [Nitrospinota bacterium]
MNKTVSVVVPAYNAQKTITACLAGLFSQSYPEELYEVIVVDDGSTDNTGAFAKNFPVRYIRQENSGPATARNAGAKESRGGLIMFTDSDCVPTNKWIEEMARPFGDPQVAAVKGAYKTTQGSLTARFAQVEFEERFEMLKAADSIDMVDTYSAAFRAEVFWGAGGFDESFPAANNEDTDLSYKLSSAGKRMVFNPSAIVFHMGHPATPCRYARVKFWRGYWRMVVYGRYPEKMVKDTYTPQTLKLQIAFVFGGLGLLSLAPFSDMAAKGAIIMALAFLGVAAPFTSFALMRDPAVGLLAPLFLAWRALVIGSGVAYYLAKKKRRATQPGEPS